MFTGIIEELGTIAHMDRRPDSIRLTIQAHKVLEGTQLGDSIAVNGVCLTVTDMTDSTFSADVMHETMRRSSFSTIKSGSKVNLERAMQVGGRLGGHIVSGHIDGVGHVARIATDGHHHFHPERYGTVHRRKRVHHHRRYQLDRRIRRQQPIFRFHHPPYHGQYDAYG